MTLPVAIVGGGLAGLSCALSLREAGVEFRLSDADQRLGGRVQTDEVDGFRLDRGFQVLFDAYPECRRLLDYDALDLRPFKAGALVWRDGRFHRLVDPWRDPRGALLTLASGVGSLGDKLRVARLRRRLRRTALHEIWSAPERSIRSRLEAEGFSAPMIDGFLRPLFAGISLDPSLESSSRVFDFTFRMMAVGRSVLPARGMGAISEQLAKRLRPDWIATGRRVRAVARDGITTEAGERLPAAAVVVATEAPATAGLLEGFHAPPSRGVACLYFAAPQPPLEEALLALDGSGAGPVNNLCVPSLVAPTLAPPGQALVSATVLASHDPGGERLEGAVRDQLRTWFGGAVRGWRHLRTYRIAHAQPAQPPGSLDPPQRPVERSPGLFVCGDHRDNASINGALESGRRAAEAVLARLGREPLTREA
jgi:phytoene dehydrogenase-like protein